MRPNHRNQVNRRPISVLDCGIRSDIRIFRHYSLIRTSENAFDHPVERSRWLRLDGVSLF